MAPGERGARGGGHLPHLGHEFRSARITLQSLRVLGHVHKLVLEGREGAVPVRRLRQGGHSLTRRRRTAAGRHQALQGAEDRGDWERRVCGWRLAVGHCAGPPRVRCCRGVVAPLRASACRPRRSLLLLQRLGCVGGSRREHVADAHVPHRLLPHAAQPHLRVVVTVRVLHRLRRVGAEEHPLHGAPFDGVRRLARWTRARP